MEGFSSAELAGAFNLDTALNLGLLPMVHDDPDCGADILRTHVNTYLKEELQSEGLIRNISPFLRFMSIAGQINGQAFYSQNISREAAVARSTVGTYFAILADTLVGHILPAWRPGLKARETAHPKFTGLIRAWQGRQRVCCLTRLIGSGWEPHWERSSFMN